MKKNRNCFCTHTSLSTPSAEQDCDRKCVGDDSEICGGSNSISVFKITCIKNFT